MSRAIRTLTIVVLLVAFVLGQHSASAAQGGGSFSHRFLNGDLSAASARTLTGLIHQALRESEQDLDGFAVTAQTTVMWQQGSVISCETTAVLRSLSSKLARSVSVAATYNLKRSTWQVATTDPNFTPPVSQSMLQAQAYTDVTAIRANKQSIEQQGAPLTKSTTGAYALVMAPISGSDTRAGWAANRILGKMRAGGWSTDMFTGGGATESAAWSYLKNGSNLLTWYSNSHGITANYNGAGNTGLVYSGTSGYDGNLMYNEFNNLSPYSGLVYNVAYIDACNSYMNPLRSSITANHNVRTYIGGVKLMPFTTSDNADARFYKYLLTDGQTIAYSLSHAASDYGLTGYYAYTGFNGAFGPRPLRAEVTWGAAPRDLDFHVWMPNYHVYYGSRGSLTVAPFASLIGDDANGYGPEAISMAEAYGGAYSYKVYNYSNERSLAGSGAKVKLYRGSVLIKTITVPTSGSGRWWNVFTYKGTTGEIVVQNTLSDVSGTLTAAGMELSMPAKP